MTVLKKHDEIMMMVVEKQRGKSMDLMKWKMFYYSMDSMMLF